MYYCSFRLPQININIKCLTPCPLTEWITGQRIALAKELLADPRCNIAEAGWACGFSAPSYFIRVFHQKTGATPRVYRQLKG